MNTTISEHSESITIDENTRLQIIQNINNYKQLLTEKYLVGITNEKSKRILKTKVIESDQILDKLCLHQWYDDYIETEINNMRPITYCLLCERTLNYK